MPGRNIIVIGGSAGSGTAIRQILASLPKRLSAAVFVAVHRSLISGEDYLPSILQGLGILQAALARDNEIFQLGRVYVGPCEGHLFFEHNRLRIERNGSPRDSIDALFRSAARSHGRRVIGVILSGMLSDGTAGFWQIRKCGGITISQHPSDATYSSMPQNAMKDVPVDYCLRTEEIGPKLLELVEASAPEPVSRVGRIMVVEDEFTIAADLEAQITDLGYEVVASVVSGEEALEIAAAVRPDVAIMDVRLAGKMRGTETARQLRERFQIPAVFLTAYADLETICAARAAMPSAFLSKPHRGAELNFAIQLALDEKENLALG